MHRDLLEQARQLARHEPKRPKQASLRRSVSTAYYALFHLLLDAVSKEIVSGNGHEHLRQNVARALNHSDMKKGCQVLASWNPKNPPSPLAEILPSGPSPAIVTISSAFVDLQQARHEADYDLTIRFSRSDALSLVKLAEDSFSAFKTLQKKDPARRIFLLHLMFHGRWKRG